ncbi:alpha/beta fold hydrolase [Planomonospora algeriensis]
MEPVRLGGTTQWLHIRGEDRGNPVLLFLHGGPGNPYMGFAHMFQKELEKHFTVVQWDQRGSGKSFPGTLQESLTVAQFEADTHELVLLLCERFRTGKIYLAGHSWGAYLGLTEARRHPENLHAYIGTGQLINLLRQETASHRYLLDEAARRGQSDALAALEGLGYPPYRQAARDMGVKYSWMWKFGGMLSGRRGPFRLVRAMLLSRTYSLRDMAGFVKGMSFTIEGLARNEGEDFWKLAAPDPVPAFEVPVFFIMGTHDRVTPLPLVAEYAAKATAPVMEVCTMEGAGHFAFLEDPERFTRTMRRILIETS